MKKLNDYQTKTVGMLQDIRNELERDQKKYLTANMQPVSIAAMIAGIESLREDLLTLILKIRDDD